MTGSEFIHAATWARLVPDLVFLGGAGLLLLFVVRAITRDVALRRSEKGSERTTVRRAA